MGDEKSRSANFCSLPQSCSLRLRKGSGWQYDSRRELATYLKAVTGRIPMMIRPEELRTIWEGG